ncbi:hypothetical protein ABT167_37300 [Streptomyces sp. NPDC001792]|uniref:hypothetical protein n=1 Tax=Streptomyces sp. NPDC001792 TaxID=3154524 RepID=UPI00332CE116
MATNRNGRIPLSRSARIIAAGEFGGQQTRERGELRGDWPPAASPSPPQPVDRADIAAAVDEASYALVP